MTHINSNIRIEPNSDRDALSRMTEVYGKPQYGKAPLLYQCLAGGMILKETGLMDVFLGLDQSNEFREADNSRKAELARQALRPFIQPPPTDEQ